MKVQAIIPGEPEPAARPRSFARCPGNVAACAGKTCRPFLTVYTKKADKDFRARAVETLKSVKPAPGFITAVGVSVLFVLPRPTTEHRKTAPVPRRWHVARPDADNLLKALLDAAVEAGWLSNDTIVSRTVVEKVAAAQGEEPCTKFAVYDLEPYGI